MKKRHLTPFFLPILSACAPFQSQTSPPSPVRYQGGGAAVMSAIAEIAPGLKPVTLRQPWRAEDLNSNRVLLRAHSSLGGFGSMSAAPLEILFTATSTDGATTLTYAAAPMLYPTVAELFEKLDIRFKRLN